LMKWQGLRFHATGLWQVGANLGFRTHGNGLR
jgi:hypothetical protein